MMRLRFSLFKQKRIPYNQHQFSSSPSSKVRSSHKFDEEAFRKYLFEKQVIGSEEYKDSSNFQISQFSHGQSNPTFIINTGTQKLVMRKQPPGKLLQGAHAVDREYRVMTSLKQASNVPVPQTRHYCPDSQVIGTPFFIYDYVEGRFFKDPLLAKIDSSANRSEIYHSMLDTLAKIHSVNIDTSSLSDYGVRYSNAKNNNTTATTKVIQPYLLRQIKTWSKAYRSTETEQIIEMDKLIEHLSMDNLLPINAENQTCLVHGDFRLDNVILNQDTNTIAAVLDWELSTLGDRLSDVAYFSLPYFLGDKNPFLQGFGTNTNFNESGIPSFEESIAYYGTRVEFHSQGVLKTPSLEDMNYYMAFSFFRSAAILQGVYKRSMMGNASAENANIALSFAKTCCSRGWELLQLYQKQRENKYHLNNGNNNNNNNSGSSLGNNYTTKREMSTTSTPSSSSLPSSSSSSLPSSSSSSLKVQSKIPPLISHLISPRATSLINKAAEFINELVLPKEQAILDHSYNTLPHEKWTKIPSEIDFLKKEARKNGLWNLFLPIESDKDGVYGAGLTNLEYAPIAELTGYFPMLCPEAFNCSAPDTGNMETILRYGTTAQKQEWLEPLLDGTIRSAFAMTEPDVASSDATNMQATIKNDENSNNVILNGRKWWISGAQDPRCKIVIFMGRTAGDLCAVPAHQRHSMVLVPMNTPGVQIIRPMKVMGFDDAPHGHAEMLFDNVIVPRGNILLGEGRGFEIAQGRLGPGRIHHCMRLIGMAERALQFMIHRATTRVAFGKPLADQGTIRHDIAMSRVEIDQARLICLNAARMMDEYGNKIAKHEIAQAKIITPAMAKKVIDRSIQIHGGAGLSQDFPMAHLWTAARVLQLADGPDQVHIASLAKHEISLQAPDYKTFRKSLK